MENSNINLSSDFKKMWNNELIEIYGEDSHEARDLIYKDKKRTALEYILTFIRNDIRYNSRLSTKKEWVDFFVEVSGKKKSIFYSVINQMIKTRVLLEIGPNKLLIPDLHLAIILKIEDEPIVMKSLLPSLITRKDQEQLWEEKNQIARYFLKRDNIFKKKRKLKI